MTGRSYACGRSSFVSQGIVFLHYCRNATSQNDGSECAAVGNQTSFLDCYWTVICFGFCFNISLLGICTVRTPSLLSQAIASAFTFSGNEKRRSKLP